VARSVGIGLAASSVGLVAGGPIGYAAATLYWLRREGISDEGATLVGWLPAIFNATAMVIFALIGFLVLLLGHGVRTPNPLLLIIVSTVIAVLVTLAVRVLKSDDNIVAVVGAVRRTWSRVRRRPVDKRALAGVRKRVAFARRALRRGGWRAVVFGATLNAGFDLLSLYFLFLAASYRIDVGTMLAGYGLPEVAGRLTFLPGGLGVVEGGMVGLYRALGVRSSVAVVVVLAYRTLSFWLPTLSGVPLAVIEQRRANPAARRAH
jgi:glycosyltransferase 2 family protein